MANLPSLPSVNPGHSAKTGPERTNVGFFAECPLSDTRQTCLLCRVSNPGHSTNLPSFAECQIPGTRQSYHLCRVSNTGHSAKTGLERTNVSFFVECHSADIRQRSHFSLRMHRFWPRVLFVECFYSGTRQNASLPSVTLGKATIYSLFLLFGHV